MIILSKMSSSKRTGVFLSTQNLITPHQDLAIGTAGIIYTGCLTALMITTLIILPITPPGGGAAVTIIHRMFATMPTMLLYFHLIKTDRCNGAMLFIKSNTMMKGMTASRSNWRIRVGNFIIFSIWMKRERFC